MWGSSHDERRNVRLGSDFRLGFEPVAVFCYEFSGLIRAHGAASLLDLAKTRKGMLIPLRVSCCVSKTDPNARVVCYPSPASRARPATCSLAKMLVTPLRITLAP